MSFVRHSACTSVITTAWTCDATMWSKLHLRWRLITLRLSYSDDASWPLCRAVCLSAPRTMWLLYEPDWSKKRGSRFSSGDTFYHKVFADTLSSRINAPAVISNTKCTIVLHCITMNILWSTQNYKQFVEINYLKYWCTATNYDRKAYNTTFEYLGTHKLLQKKDSVSVSVCVPVYHKVLITLYVALCLTFLYNITVLLVWHAMIDPRFHQPPLFVTTAILRMNLAYLKKCDQLKDENNKYVDISMRTLWSGVSQAENVSP